MSPAEVEALSRVHRRVHDPHGRTAPSRGSVGDLLALSMMPRT